MKRKLTVFCPEEILEHVDDQIEVHMTWDEVFALEKEAINSCTSSDEHHHIYL
jgi:hypothetical protein